jgi:ribonucleoside-diphosphate reductase alpha chain
MRNLYDGVPIDEVYKAAILAARTLIEKDPGLHLRHRAPAAAHHRREILGEEVRQAHMAGRYAEYFPQFIKKGVRGRTARRQAAAVRPGAPGRGAEARARPAVRLPGPADPVRPLLPARRKHRIELPQAFFMRVAMGLALNEIDREARAIEFYEVLSSFDFMSSTPTLFNSGTLRSQLSSCYLTTVPTTWTAFTRPSRKTRCCPSSPAAWATTGPACAPWAATSRAPTARARAWCRS